MLKDAGFSDYLVKPVRTASLAARLASAAPGFDRTTDSADAVIVSNAPRATDGLAILVAEDNEINALLARSLLAKLGHRPTMVTDGAAALDAWRGANRDDRPFDLILMDMHMPGVDGLEAARRIRAAEAADGIARTPIIALTANAFAEDREACLAAGMDGFLIKPLDRERLAEALAGLAASRHLAA